MHQSSMQYKDCSSLSDCHPHKPVLPSCKSLLLLGPRLLSATLYAGVSVVKKTLDGSYKDEDCWHSSMHDCCLIPEGKCPDYYVGTICWNGCSGDTLKHHLQIINKGKEKRLFTLEAEPFASTDKSASIAPDSRELKPGESLKAVISFTIPDDFVGSHFSSHINIKGKYEQCLKLDLQVKPRQHCCTAIEQGEIPKRIKAHQWFHHFQCEEECFEALPVKQGDAAPGKRQGT